VPEKQPKRLPAAACAAPGDKSNFEKAAIKLKKEMREEDQYAITAISF
jgi:hypothetical protein